MRRKIIITGLFIAHWAVFLGQFVLPVLAVLWIEHSFGAARGATWLAMMAFLPLFVLIGVCVTAPLWRVLGRAADRIGAA